ncbi:MAG: hypoxanthine phosphoribosyltransferase [Candidatus Saganbacteria bacterium]|nr:hypoxanthine phosphoribosyltransferase [Candidatus Saganbacteria bacterium]
MSGRIRIKKLISRQRLQKRVSQLAGRISKDHKGKKLVLVGILKGAFVFLSDLLRQIKVPVEIDFIQVSSYGASHRSSGIIKIKKDIDLSVVGKHVLLVEDIVDYGYTMDYLLRFLKAKKPRSVNVCALLDKPSRRVVDVPIAYRGFIVPDKFVVGYGLDFAEKFRNLDHIAITGS